MSPFKLLLACVVTAGAMSAQAAPTYTVSAPSGPYGLPASFTSIGDAGYTSVSDAFHQAPTGVAAGGQYLYTSYDYSSVTVAVNASSFAFLWGTPSASNTVTFKTSLGDFAYTGTMLNSQFGTVLNTSASTVLNASLAGGIINSAVFTSTDASFETAVSLAPVPEPETYALMAAGLIAIGFMVKRKA